MHLLAAVLHTLTRPALLAARAGTYVGEFGGDKFDGQGQYRYPDGSVYTGGWRGGKKDGYGVYWDTSKGCLRGQWAAGVLKGQVRVGIGRGAAAAVAAERVLCSPPCLSPFGMTTSSFKRP